MIKIKHLKRFIQRSLLSLVILFPFSIFAQKAISGTVLNAKDKQALVGVTVSIKGTPIGTFTDANGKFSISASTPKPVLVVSFIGMQSQEIPVGSETNLSIRLEEDATILEEVVVIGYGSQKKRDLTGSITTISSKDFVGGQITSPEQLIGGKIAGVQITSNSGAPGAGSTIRIRGGSSLNASNDPLIVLDGMPLDNSEIKGASSALALINPADIETFTVLKDASATAIYGSRASNGVIMITTKKGSAGGVKVNFNTQLSYATPVKFVDVLDAAQYSALVKQRGNSSAVALLGKDNTDWQKQIYQNALTTDNNLRISGSKGDLPYIISLGYLNQNGILKTSNMSRTSIGVGLSPVLFDKHLKIDFNVKSSLSNNRFANQGAIGSAVFFDPTKPIKSGNEALGGYYEWLDPSTSKPNTLAPLNPLGMLLSRADRSELIRSIGNIVFDYKFHFVDGLRANLNVGYDISKSDGTVNVPAGLGLEFARGGLNNIYDQNKTNKTLELYLNYNKNLGFMDSKIDIMGGYSYQDFLRDNSNLDKNVKGDVFNTIFYKTQNTLVSFFGRLNYSALDKYLLTFTVRNDGSSRFSPANRWGIFPSAALAWKISDEGFLKNSETFSNMKLKLGYGITGQQDVLSDYPYLPKYTISQSTASYQLGNSFFNTLRPEGYDANIKWEETSTLNLGLEWGLKKSRISGGFDYYIRKTKDLLSVIPVPAGSNLTNSILTNVGNIENKGFEVNLNFSPVLTANASWDISFNFTRNINTITNLSKVLNPSFQGIQTGAISGGVGNNIQIHTVGFPTNSFYVFKQVYNEAGKPLEGVYADLNGDGIVNGSDYYRYKSPQPDYYMGMSSQFTKGKLYGGFVARSNIGSYVYNNVNSTAGTYRNSSTPILVNATSDVNNTGFENNQYFSDYYMENASFLRVDNVNLGYNLGKIKNKGGLILSLNVQNAFVLTKYSGLDPELQGGIDNNLFPRPRTYTLGLNLAL